MSTSTTSDIETWRATVADACRQSEAAADAQHDVLSALSQDLEERAALPIEERAWLQLELADACTSREALHAALRCVSRAAHHVAQAEPSDELLVGLASAWIRIGRHGDAIPLLKSLIVRGADDAPALAPAGNWSALGDCYLLTGAPAEAFDSFTKAAWHAEQAGASGAERAHILAQLTTAAETSGRIADGIAELERILGMRTAQAASDPLIAIDPLMRIADLAATPELSATGLQASLRAWRILTRARVDDRRARDFPIGARVLGTIGRVRRLLDEPVAAEAALRVAERRLRGIADADPVFLGEVLEHRSLLARARNDHDLALALAAEHAALARQHLAPGAEALRILNRYGTLLYGVARYADAVAAIRDALAHAPAARVPALDRARVTTNLAKALLEMGQLEAAAPELAQARTLLSEAGALDTAAEASHLIAESQWFRAHWRNADARAAAERAIGILSRLYGPDSPHLATPLSFVAGVAKDLQLWAEADAAYRRILELDGLSRLHRADALQNRVLPLLQAGRLGEAEQHANEAFAIKVAMFGEAHERTNVARYMLGLVAHHRGDHQAALTHLSRTLEQERAIYGPMHQSIARTRIKIAAVELALGRRALAESQLTHVLDSQAQRLQELFKLNSDEQRTLIARDWLFELDAYLGVALHRDAARDGHDDVYRHVLARKGLVTEALAQPHQAGSRMPGIAAAEPATPVIRNALQQGTVLIDFVSFGSAVLGEGPTVARSLTGQRRFVAFILDRTRAVRLIDLGDADAIERAAQDFWGALHARQPTDVVRSTGCRLRDLVWTPLGLDGCERVLLSTDGALNQVAFAALPDGPTGWLSDSVEIDHVTAARSLVAAVDPAAACSAPVVIASPDYGPITPEGWDDLEGALHEGHVVAERLSVPLVTGLEATADFVTRLSRPRLLHIATHGFYVPRSAASRPSSPPAVAEMLAAADPLRRAALVFAGANTWLARPADDTVACPVLSARAIADIDLRGTELVVLSACQTGLGDIEPFDGAHGLRRAFHAAGANGLVVSLWNANDRPTAHLMDQFYAALEDSGRPGAALRAASHATRDVYPHPSDWAPFIHVSSRGAG